MFIRIVYSSYLFFLHINFYLILHFFLTYKSFFNYKFRLYILSNFFFHVQSSEHIFEQCFSIHGNVVAGYCSRLIIKTILILVKECNERFNDFDRIKKNKKICNYSLFFKIYFCEFLCISFSNNQFKFLYHSNLIKFFLQLLQIISYITIDIYAIYIPIFLCN